MLSGIGGGVGANPQSAANPLGEKVKKEVGIVGIANIPNQVHYLASHAQVDFNILLMGMLSELLSTVPLPLPYTINLFPSSPSLSIGELSLGKTELINRILGTAVFENALDSSDPQGRDPSLMTIRVRQQQVVDDDVRATIRLIDAPQVGHSIRKAEGYARSKVVSYARFT